MSVATLLRELEALDIRLDAVGDRLRIDAPSGVLTTSRRKILADRKYGLLARLAQDKPEVSWRAGAMRRRLRGNGPVTLLMARDGPFAPGSCISCGEPVAPKEHGESYRCGPCACAAWLVLDDPTFVTREA